MKSFNKKKKNNIIWFFFLENSLVGLDNGNGFGFRWLKNLLSQSSKSEGTSVALPREKLQWCSGVNNTERVKQD